MLRFRFRDLLAEKERQSGRRITLAEVSAETGISRKVLSNLTSPDREIVTNTAYVEAICRYFSCPVQELIVFYPEIEADESHHVDALYPNRKR